MLISLNEIEPLILYSCKLLSKYLLYYTTTMFVRIDFEEICNVTSMFALTV